MVVWGTLSPLLPQVYSSVFLGWHVGSRLAKRCTDDQMFEVLVEQNMISSRVLQNKMGGRRVNDKRAQLGMVFLFDEI